MYVHIVCDIMYYNDDRLFFVNVKNMVLVRKRGGREREKGERGEGRIDRREGERERGGREREGVGRGEGGRERVRGKERGGR